MDVTNFSQVSSSWVGQESSPNLEVNDWLICIFF